VENLEKKPIFKSNFLKNIDGKNVYLSLDVYFFNFIKYLYFME